MCAEKIAAMVMPSEKTVHTRAMFPFTKALMADLIKNQEIRRFRPKVELSKVGTVLPSEKRLKQHPYLLIDEDVGVLNPL